MKIKVLDGTVNAFLLFSVLTLFQAIPGLENVNKIWMIITIGLLLYDLVITKQRKIDVLIILITLILHCIAIFYTRMPLYSVNMLFYYLIWVLFYTFCKNQREDIIRSLENNSQFIDFLLVFWNLVVFISALIPSCYGHAWGGAKYFNSFTGSVFRLMPSALIITGLAAFLYIQTNNKRYLLYFTMPAY